MFQLNFQPGSAKTRKPLAALISQTLEMPAVYLGPPSFAYHIGSATLQRDWILTMPNDCDAKSILDQARQAGYHTHQPNPESSHPVPQSAELEALAGGTVGASSGRVGHQGAGYGWTLGLPTTGWDAATPAKLEALLAAKGSLIAKALNIEATPIEYADGQVCFPWFTQIPDQAVITAVAALLTAMVEYAKTATRITTKPVAAGNDKYAMRCFLLRLGFIGPETRQVRKTLTAQLEGSAAWRTPPAKRGQEPK